MSETGVVHRVRSVFLLHAAIRQHQVNGTKEFPRKADGAPCAAAQLLLRFARSGDEHVGVDHNLTVALQVGQRSKRDVSIAKSSFDRVARWVKDDLLLPAAVENVVGVRVCTNAIPMVKFGRVEQDEQIAHFVLLLLSHATLGASESDSHLL